MDSVSDTPQMIVRNRERIVCITTASSPYVYYI